MLCPQETQGVPFHVTHDPVCHGPLPLKSPFNKCVNGKVNGVAFEENIIVLILLPFDNA